MQQHGKCAGLLNSNRSQPAAPLLQMDKGVCVYVYRQPVDNAMRLARSRKNSGGMNALRWIDIWEKGRTPHAQHPELREHPLPGAWHIAKPCCARKLAYHLVHVLIQIYQCKPQA